jgi:hypothetical protein
MPNEMYIQTRLRLEMALRIAPPPFSFESTGK